MRRDLGAFLESDPSVIFRTTGRARSRTVPGVAVDLVSHLLFFALAFYVMKILIGFELDRSTVVLFGPMIVVALVLPAVGSIGRLKNERRHPELVVVTHHRVYHRPQPGDHPEMIELDEIEGVTCRGDIEIIGKDRTWSIPQMRDWDRLAEAIATAADVPKPPPVGRMAVNAGIETGAAGTLVAVASVALLLFALPFVGLIPPVAETPEAEPRYLDLAIVFTPAVALGIFLGRPLGVLARLWILRRAIDPQAMRDGIRAMWGDRWFCPTALRWARYLYGGRWPADLA